MSLLRTRIAEHFEHLSPELQRAARWINDHPLELVTQSMRRSARAAGVAPATMTRLAKALGFRGFEDLRLPEVQSAVGQSSHFAIKAATQQAHRSEAQRGALELAQQQSANLNSVLQRNSVASIERVADRLIEAQRVVFLGMRAAHGIAFHLYYSCHLLMSKVQLAGDGAGTVQDQIWELGGKDVLVVIGQSPYARQTVELAQSAAAQGVPVVALTDSSLSPLAQVATEHLLFDGESPSFFHSLTGAQALAEALVATVAARGGEAVMRRLVAMEQRLNAAQAYWEKPNNSKLGVS